MKLDLLSLENAVTQLKEGLVLYDSDIVRQFPIIRNQMRAGAIPHSNSPTNSALRLLSGTWSRSRPIPRRLTDSTFGT